MTLISNSKLSTIITKDPLVPILRIQTEILFAIHDFFIGKGFLQLMPVVLSPITDPLCHPVYDAQIKYLGQQFQLTKSMIFHKQIAISTLNHKGIYIMSPNIRLELSDLRNSGKHLTEFTQLDIELKEATGQKFMSLTEDLIIHIFSRVRDYCKAEIDQLGVNILVPKKPFSVYCSWDLREEFGNDFGSKISYQNKDPYWITDFKREFYDKEDPERKGHYLNYDLFYPEGFGEALSGGERDYEYETLVRKIKERNQDWKQFESYLIMAKQGLLAPSAGGGLGIERLVRFLTKKRHIREVSLFPKVPGEKIYF
ncbi:MAG: asparagine synthetase A [Candidatus Thorarchaeota archaeon]